MDTNLTSDQSTINLGVRAVGDLQETKDGMAVANMTILSFDAPTKNNTIYKKDSFVDSTGSTSNSPIINIETGPSDIEKAMGLMATVFHSLEEKE